MIRNSSKALLLHQGKILLNRCRHSDGSAYYDLPGGGQQTGESMEECLRREVLEETGYPITKLCPVAIAEEIYTDAALRKQYPEYCHRIIHLFSAELAPAKRVLPLEKDWAMEESEWIPLQQVADLPELLPYGLKEKVDSILSGKQFTWLGTQYLDWKET